MNDLIPISIVVADDHAILREGIISLCQAQSDLTVVGQAADGSAAVEIIRSFRPDFAVIDLHMPKLNGLQVIRKLRAERCETRFIVLSVSRDEVTIREALKSGANAYLLKDGPSRHLLEAIQYIRDGGVYISPLLQGASIFGNTRAAECEDPLASLSSREYQVFSYLVNGLRPKDIANLLDISPKTIDTYRASLMRKLNIHDLVSLVKFAIERKLTSPAPPA